MNPIDVRRERPTTPPAGDEVDVAPGGAASTRFRSGASAATAGRRLLLPGLTAYGPALTEAQLVAGYRCARREDDE